MSIYDDGPAEANRSRAYWALTALEAFGKETGQAAYLDGTLNIGTAELYEIGGDLLADLFHLARLNGCAPEVLTAQGATHFDEEVEEEQQEQWEKILDQAKAAGIKLMHTDIEWTTEGPTIDGMDPTEWIAAMASEA